MKRNKKIEGFHEWMFNTIVNYKGSASSQKALELSTTHPPNADYMPYVNGYARLVDVMKDIRGGIDVAVN